MKLPMDFFCQSLIEWATKIEKGDDSFTMTIGQPDEHAGGLDLKIAYQKSIQGFTVCVNVQVNGVTMEYNNPAGAHVKEFWATMQDRYYDLREVTHNQDRKDVLEALQELYTFKKHDELFEPKV